MLGVLKAPLALGALGVATATAVWAPFVVLGLGVLLLLGCVTAIAALFPALTYFAGLTIVALSPENFFPGNVPPTRTLVKLLVLCSVVPLVLTRGVELRGNTPLAAFLLTLALTFAFSSLHPALTPASMVTSSFAFILPFGLISIRFEPEMFGRLCRLIAWLPALSVVLSIFTTAAGVWPIGKADFTGAWRLQGLNIPSYLAVYGFNALAASMYLAVIDGRRAFFALAFLNLCFIAASGTRTPTACAMFFAGTVYLFARNATFHYRQKIALGLVGGVALAGMMAAYLPQLLLRFEASGVGGANAINLSGRDNIWAYYLAAIRAHPYWGQGVGAGNELIEVVDYHVGSFAAHNEYLRFAADYGIVGTSIIFAGVGLWLVSLLRIARQDQKVFIVALTLGLAIYSFTDNPITSPGFILTMSLLASFSWMRRHELAKEAAPSPLPGRHHPLPSFGSARPA